MKFLLLAFIFSLPALGVGYTRMGFSPTPNFEFMKVPDSQTTDATETVIHSMTLPDPATWIVKVSCEARKSDGSKREGFIKTALVYRSGGGAVIEGSVVNAFVQSGLDYDMTIGVSSNDFEIKVTGAASDTVDWRCVMEQQKLE